MAKARKLAILIDANIYLDLYAAQASLSNLLTPLSQLNGLFVSRQLADEVARNRLRIATEALTKHVETAKASIAIPEEMLSDFKGSVTKDLKKFNEAAADLKRTLGESIRETLAKITSGDDPISSPLRKLFERAAQPTAEELARARDRRERGNPPGKRNDPLGDQLTWEQFLSYAAGSQKIFVVTRDSDYALKCQGVLFLNPLLLEDVKRVAPGCEVEVHDNIAKALRSLKEAGLLAPGVKIPTFSELAVAQRVEEDAAAISSHIRLAEFVEAFHKASIPTQDVWTEWIRRHGSEEFAPPHVVTNPEWTTARPAREEKPAQAQSKKSTKKDDE